MIFITFGTYPIRDMIGRMAYWYKIGLLVLNEDSTKFLVCEKDRRDITNKYLMPGGQMEEEDAMTCLKREIKEELDCSVDTSKVTYIGEYTDIAAGEPEHEVTIDLYQGDLIGKPKPSLEVKQLHWIGKEDADNNNVSGIIRYQIIPSLVEKGILK